MTRWYQRQITLAPRSRGLHLITDEVVRQLPELHGLGVGIAHFFLQHTSASLAINENADPTVRRDFESHFNYMVPENAPYYQHNYEGPDDMPAHIRAALTQTSLSIPVIGGRAALGTWQGVYLFEHRDAPHTRHVVAQFMKSG